MREQNLSIARLENDFIFNAQYQLTAREQKIMLFLISNINPNEPNFEVQIISLKKLESVIMTKRSGSFYDEILEFSTRISTKQIIFDSTIGINKKKIKGIINWFGSILPVHNDNGEVCLEFIFSEKLKPFLLQLKEYAQIDYQEVLPLASSYSIRMYKVFKAFRQKMGKHQKRSKLRYELLDLKKLLGIEDKYPIFSNFRIKVLELFLREINGLTNIGVEMRMIKKGKTIVALEFEFWDKSKGSNVDSMEGEGSGSQIEDLSFAQQKAFDNLVVYGVNSGIALGLVSKPLGSEILGFEDWYFEECIKVVESKSTAQIEGTKAGIFVNWFLKKKVFEQGDHFAKIMETLSARKKKLEKENPSAWENRLAARGMTAEAFREMVKG